MNRGLKITLIVVGSLAVAGGLTYAIAKMIRKKKDEKKADKVVAEPKNNAKDLKDLQIAFNTLASKNKTTSDSKKEKDFLSKLFNETDPNKIDLNYTIK